MALKIHVARKDHICDECGEKIPKGDKYWRDYDQCDDGSIIDKKSHTNCELYLKKYIAVGE
ncbi:MAG: hypothetical protein H6937_07075 [Burkholderiales bacterium]|nr:hypothetical protein [Burkholderiales bacterium]